MSLVPLGLEKLLQNIKENILSNSFLKFVHNFWFEAWNLKYIFGDESEIDYSTFISSKFFEKNLSTMPKWGLEYYL